MFGVGMCAPKCREDNDAFMIGLIICCGLFSLCLWLATILYGYYVGTLFFGVYVLDVNCHGIYECVNTQMTFGFLLFALLNSAACVAFACVACCCKAQSKRARIQEAKKKPKPPP